MRLPRPVRRHGFSPDPHRPPTPLSHAPPQRKWWKQQQRQCLGVCKPRLGLAGPKGQRVVGPQDHTQRLAGSGEPTSFARCVLRCVHQPCFSEVYAEAVRRARGSGEMGMDREGCDGVMWR